MAARRCDSIPEKDFKEAIVFPKPWGLGGSAWTITKANCARGGRELQTDTGNVDKEIVRYTVYMRLVKMRASVGVVTES